MLIETPTVQESLNREARGCYSRRLDRLLSSQRPDRYPCCDQGYKEHTGLKKIIMAFQESSYLFVAGGLWLGEPNQPGNRPTAAVRAALLKLIGHGPARSLATVTWSGKTASAAGSTADV